MNLTSIFSQRSIFCGFIFFFFLNKSRIENPNFLHRTVKKNPVFGPTLKFLIKGSLREPKEKERKKLVTILHPSHPPDPDFSGACPPPPKH